MQSSFLPVSHFNTLRAPQIIIKQHKNIYSNTKLSVKRGTYLGGFSFVVYCTSIFIQVLRVWMNFWEVFLSLTSAVVQFSLMFHYGFRAFW